MYTQLCIVDMHVRNNLVKPRYPGVGNIFHLDFYIFSSNGPFPLPLVLIFYTKHVCSS